MLVGASFTQKLHQQRFFILISFRVSLQRVPTSEASFSMWCCQNVQLVIEITARRRIFLDLFSVLEFCFEWNYTVFFDSSHAFLMLIRSNFMDTLSNVFPRRALVVLNLLWRGKMRRDEHCPPHAR